MKAQPFLLSLLSLFAVSAASDYQATSGEALHFKIMPEHYIDYPISRKDFSNWRTVGAAVTMRNRTVIAPEARDKKGIMYNVHPNQLVRDWIVEVEVEIGNKKQSSRGGTGLGLFYVKNIDQVSHQESIFGYSNRYEGVGIYLNSQTKSERGSKNEVTNAIQGFYNDGQRIINVFQEKGHQCYKKFRNLPLGQFVKLRLQYDYPLISLHVYDHSTQSFDFCFSFEVNLDFNGYFILSGSSGGHNPDHIFLNSFALYDPKTPAQNNHFIDSRHAKLKLDDISLRIQKGVKDLFERHSQQDMQGSSDNSSIDVAKLIDMIPVQFHHINHKLERTVAQFTEDDNRFFDSIRGVQQQSNYQDLKEKFYNFRMAIDSLNENLDKDLQTLRQYDRKLKQVRYTSNMQKGLTQFQVNNKHTKTLQSQIQEVDERLKLINQRVKDFQSISANLGEKIRREGSDFTERLEESRKKFAQQQSQELQYDMSEIDAIFNNMELTVKASGLGSIIINIGMIIVILVSAFLWLKMRAYENKNQ